MQVVQAPRASAILYSVLVSGRQKRPWLLPANICAIVPITFLKAQVPFEFVDISPQTLHMNLEQVEALISAHRFGGLLYAHTYGEASTPNHFFESLKKLSPELTLIDDRCLCLPALEPDPASQADIQLYSTGYAKIVDLHFGGYAFLRTDMDYRPAHLAFRPEQHEVMEASYKQALAGRTKFVYQDSDWLDTESPVPPWQAYRQQIEKALIVSLEHRAKLNQIYADRLPPEIQLRGGYQTWRFNIRVKHRDDLLARVFSAGLFASSHYASLAGVLDDRQAPQAETLAGEVINLFNDHHFTPDQAEQVCRIILEDLA